MSLFDSVKGLLGGALGQMEAQLLPELLSKALSATNLGSLQGLLDRLKQSGLEPQVASWLGSGPNLPITAQQLEAVLGDTVVNKLSSTLNMPPDQIFGFLAQQLPGIIDKLSPHGTLQSP